MAETTNLTNQSSSQETVASYRMHLEFSATDEDLLLAIEKAKKDSMKVKEKIDKIAQRNLIYWQNGTSIDYSRVHPRQSRAIVNRIFTDVETIIPILTSESPEPTVINTDDNDVRFKVTEALKDAFDVKYKMQQVLQKDCRNWFIYRIGVLKYRWDKENGFITEVVLPTKMGFDDKATKKENCEFMWEEMEDSVEDLKAKFPGKAKEIDKEIPNNSPKSKVRYLEFWGGGGQWVAWRLNKIILDKKKNPNFDYEDQANNIFEQPEFPYILLTVFCIGNEMGLYDNTSLIEESIPVQDAVNALEQQIFDLNQGRKRVWVFAGTSISEKKAQSVVNETGDLGIYLDRAEAVPNAVSQVQSGTPDAAMYNNLTHLLSEIDNIMGVHSTTRGERAQQETATGRQLLLGSDYGRLDMIVRNIEQVCEEWFNAYLHMIKVYSMDIQTVYLDKQKIELKPEDIPSGIGVMVTKGSTLPTDDATKRADAIQLAQFGMIDPKTLYEELGYSNIDQRVQDFYQWMQATGKIVPQQPQMSQGTPQGQPQAAQGQPIAQPQQGQDQGAKVQQVREVLSSPQFQRASDEDKLKVLQAARQIVGGGGQPTQ